MYKTAKMVRSSAFSLWLLSTGADGFSYNLHSQENRKIADEQLALSEMTTDKNG